MTEAQSTSQDEVIDVGFTLCDIIFLVGVIFIIKNFFFYGISAFVAFMTT